MKLHSEIKNQAKGIVIDLQANTMNAVNKYFDNKITFKQYNQLLKAYQKKAEAEIVVLVSTAMQIALKS